MVRAPCCEKMGLKKGPWTLEEDQILINYIQLYGHGNWRALPKQAGLLRCGKSCRLRWTNYLRPDIKRGNFTREEEDTIIKLHEMLGNRWSAIAARLPGRTDNEIKNVWHTHLKKRRLKQDQEKIQRPSIDISRIHQKPTTNHQESADPSTTPMTSQATDYRPISPQQCSSDTSSVTTVGTDQNVESIKVESSDDFSEILDDTFWSEVLSADNSSTNDDFPVVGPNPQINFPFSPLLNSMEAVDTNNSNVFDESMEYFWYNLFTRAGDLPELQEI